MGKGFWTGVAGGAIVSALLFMVFHPTGMWAFLCGFVPVFLGTQIGSQLDDRG